MLRRLRLPYGRKAAPEVIATAASQRLEHAEMLRALLAEEAAGPLALLDARDRDRISIAGHEHANEPVARPGVTCAAAREHSQ